MPGTKIQSAAFGHPFAYTNSYLYSVSGSHSDPAANTVAGSDHSLFT